MRMPRERLADARAARARRGRRSTSGSSGIAYSMAHACEDAGALTQSHGARPRRAARWGASRCCSAGDRVAVGVSGGKDSLCLLHALVAYRRRAPFPYDIVAVTVEQGKFKAPIRALETQIARPRRAVGGARRARHAAPRRRRRRPRLRRVQPPPSPRALHDRRRARLHRCSRSATRPTTARRRSCATCSSTAASRRCRRLRARARAGCASCGRSRSSREDAHDRVRARARLRHRRLRVRRQGERAPRDPRVPDHAPRAASRASRSRSRRRSPTSTRTRSSTRRSRSPAPTRRRSRARALRRQVNAPDFPPDVEWLNADGR